MSECSVLRQCPFFRDEMSEMPATADLLKKRFCLSDNARCARWIVLNALGGDAVPSDLFPTQAGRARDLLDGVTDSD